MATLKLGVLGSGSGSNMQSIVDAIEKGELDAEIRIVLADVPEAYILSRMGNPWRSVFLLVILALDLVVEALGRGEEVKLSGFGVFQVRSKRARMGRNPKTGEPAAIDPRRVISFRASQVLKARVGKASAS